MDATERVYVFRLRNYKDLESIVAELSAMADKKTVMDIYNAATSQPFSFLYVNLVAHDKNKMFYVKFEKQIEIEN